MEITKKKQIVDRILAHLREWGWDTGLEKLKAELERTQDDQARGILQLFMGWMAGERGLHAEALKQMRAVKQLPHLEAWALLGQAFVRMREGSFKAAHKLLDQALKQAAARDSILHASIAHCRGSNYYHEGRNKQALEELKAALSGFGRNHFCTGRVLDSLAMVYSSKDHFHAARELYSLALKYKQRHGDDAGCALTHGQLGRLYLDWEQLSHAEEHFRNDLQLSRAMGDVRGEALMHNSLARVCIARQDWDTAVHELERSLQVGETRGWTVIEGFTRKDLAHVLINQGKTREATGQLKKARKLFESMSFQEGLAHVNRVQGILFRIQGKPSASEDCLQKALLYFESSEEKGEAARTKFEIARTLRAVSSKLAIGALTEALSSAEQCRRDALVREIEDELKQSDELAYHRRIYQRARGRNVAAGTESLFSGKAENVSVIFLDVQGSTQYAKDLEPEDVMITMNQMMAEFVGILKRHQVFVAGYRGDGFMAIVRERNHARRAVAASLEMVQAMKEFNDPRELIRQYEDPQVTAEMKPLNIRIGISTGEVFLGNIGTYEKMDFTALGNTCNLGARLETEASPLIPCISQATYDRVKNDFSFTRSKARSLTLKGLEDSSVNAWDVAGFKF